MVMRYRGGGIGHRSTRSCDNVLRSGTLAAQVVPDSEMDMTERDVEDGVEEGGDNEEGDDSGVDLEGDDDEGEGERGDVDGEGGEQSSVAEVASRRCRYYHQG